MWSKKLRKIVDLSVLGAIGVTVLTVGGVKVLKDRSEYKDYSAEYDRQKQAALDAQRDETGHIPSKIKAVAPTETTVGYTAGTKCIECGEIYKGHQEIPMLTEEYYDRSIKTGSSSVSVTWKLKEEYTEGLGNLQYSKTYTKGFIKVGSTNYLDVEFNKAFPGVEMKYDESESMITLNVTKEGGYTFEGKTFSIGYAGMKLKITGEPLTIITDGGSDALNIESNTCDLIVENELDVHIVDRINTTGSKSAIAARKVTIAEGGCLRTSNFYYGIYTREDVDVNGEVDIAGVNKAFYYSSATNGGKNLVVAPGRNLYVKEAKKALVDDSTYLLQNCDKHVSVCKSETNIEHFITYKLVELISAPTENTTGSATFICAGCGNASTKKTVTLPTLNETDYVVEKTPTLIDGETKYVNCYTYFVPNMKTDKLVFDKREDLTSYFTVGGSYFTVTGWNEAYSKAQAQVVGNTFTITMTGDATFNLGSDGGIDFSIFDEVKILGTGTFKVVTNQVSALIATKLTVGENVTLTVDGTNCSKTTYITEDRDGKFDGIVTTEGLDIQGKVNITNFYVGMLANGNTTLGSAAKVNITKTIYGFYCNGESTFTSNGEFTFTNTATATKYTTAVGFYSYRAKVTYHFTGNSVTNVKQGNQGFGTVDSNTANNVTIRVSGDAKLTSQSTNTGTTNYAASNINHLIVENENGSQCNAEVSFIANSSAAFTFLANTSADHSFIINSTKDVVFWKDGSKVSQNGINFNGGKYNIKVLSLVRIQRFNIAMNFSSVTINSAVCDHKINTDWVNPDPSDSTNYACNINFGGTIPDSIAGTINDWLYTK